MTLHAQLMLALIQAYRDHDKHTIRILNARLAQLKEKSA